MYLFVFFAGAIFGGTVGFATMALIKASREHHCDCKCCDLKEVYHD